MSNTIKLWDFSPVNKKSLQLCKDMQEKLYQSNSKVLLINGESSDNNNLCVFKHFNNEYWTQKYVGVLCDEKNTFVINSRFDKNNPKQFFLNYVFTKAFDESGKIFEEMNPTSSRERTWEFLLIIMFVRQLEKSFKKGLYKQYSTFEYNDSKIKGRIDVARHLKLNPIFNGNISYSTRENTIINDYNRLFLLVYDMIMKKYPTTFSNLLSKNRDIKKQVDFIRNELSTFIQPDKKTILKNSSKPIIRHIYIEYEQLRKISILILKRMGLNVFDNGSKDIYGVLIDITKLWEKFLEVSIKENNNNVNIQPQTKYQLFEYASRKIQPDFIVNNKDIKNSIVLDAKYRTSWSKGIDDEGNRNDIFQVLSYMYRLNLNYCGVIYPTQETADKTKSNKILDSQGNYFFTIPIVVPQANIDYNKFKEKFENNIVETLGSIDKLYDKINIG